MAREKPTPGGASVDRTVGPVITHPGATGAAEFRFAKQRGHYRGDGPEPWIIRAMPQFELFRGRRAAVLENRDLKVVVLEGGGHIAAVLDKATGVNPLWAPPWASIEPSAFGPESEALYGSGSDGRLLAGIMGHNLCLDIFGGPSAEEAAAGLTAHGEGSVATYHFDVRESELVACAEFPLAHLRFERRLALLDRAVRVRERLTNLDSANRANRLDPACHDWSTFSGGRNHGAAGLGHEVADVRGGLRHGRLPPARRDLRLAGGPAARRGPRRPAALHRPPSSSAYTCHLMDPAQPDAFFVAFSPRRRLAFGYVWRTADFPWMGIWEENRSRAQPPWNGTTVTRGLEFGVSPVPESRREMVERGRLFGAPTFSWLPARTTKEVEYWIVCRLADMVPERLERPG